ncbi:hypothetical protein QWY85_05265 [Neolewinella lacunae]|uniref:Uncharacterized protein n=1 Tax=Neolewinella lacunae TaxID=1517758 RepID=A0A923T918_9BACT|nr:hypothetical protein [Neolewinella lacunae]MBC6995109.1 hypothetical protein [Neolewinella lacunae]MDN3634059.1 hypothetical protein [Neolewinella lacunae]
MEKIFHEDHLADAASLAPSLDGDQVQLKSQHLWLSAQVAENAFGGERQVYAVYYPQRGALLLAPMSDTAFKSLHECSLVMLKDRNLGGDKSLSLQEIIIDNELDEHDRPLAFSARPGWKMLQVFLKTNE